MFRRVAVLGALLACALVPSYSHAQTALGTYYMAIGDSLAYGVTAPGITPDPTCKSSTAPGYVCIVYGYLKQVKPGLQLENLGVAEMDSCVLVNGYGNGSPCTNKPTNGDVASPIATAVQFLKDHPGQVGPITINVGGADLIPLLPSAVSDPAGTAAKLPALFTIIQKNLDTALSQLRTAAGPNAQIVLISQYNPLGGLTSPPLPTGLPDTAAGAIRGLNNLEAGVAAKYNVQVSDVGGAFDAHPGGAALLTFVPPTLAAGDPSKIDVYPTIEGYRLYGQTVLKTLGFQAPAKSAIKLSKSSIKHGKTEKVKGTTISGADVTITISLPKAKTVKQSAAADNNGAYTLSFSVGKRAGKATVRACASDAVTGRSVCSKKATITVQP